MKPVKTIDNILSTEYRLLYFIIQYDGRLSSNFKRSANIRFLLKSNGRKTLKSKHMDIEQVIILSVTGATAGWLSGLIVKGKGFGLLGNSIIGIIGAVLGAWIFDVLDVRLSGEWIEDIVRAIVGAILLIFAFMIVRKKIPNPKAR